MNNELFLTVFAATAAAIIIGNVVVGLGLLFLVRRTVMNIAEAERKQVEKYLESYLTYKAALGQVKQNEADFDFSVTKKGSGNN